jgi:aminoglycoside 3-N-acetyltransferase
MNQQSEQQSEQQPEQQPVQSQVEPTTSAEYRIVQATPSPNTVDSLMQDLRALGLRSGSVCLVHAALSALGWTCGGAQAVIMALVEVLGPDGTLVMPAHSGDLSDPALWRNPPVPAAWHELIRASMPAFRADLTPPRGMSSVARLFMAMDGVVRSAHPQVSFAAYGPDANFITRDHVLAFGLGENSPLARMYDLDAEILLLGVGYDSCTGLHLAEYRTDWPGKTTIKQGAPLNLAGRREWVWFDDLDIDSDDFPACGADFEYRWPGDISIGMVGIGQSRLVHLRGLVDFGIRWFPEHRISGSGVV